jgi:hypothetical protein
VAGAEQAREAGDSDGVLTLLDALPPEAQTVATQILTGEALSRLGRWEQAEAVLAKLENGSLCEPEVLAVALIRTINLLHGGASVGEVLAVSADALAYVTTAAARRTLRVHEAYVRVALGQVGAGPLPDLPADPHDRPNKSHRPRPAPPLARPIAVVLVGSATQRGPLRTSPLGWGPVPGVLGGSNELQREVAEEEAR